MGHIVTHYSFQDEMFSMLILFGLFIFLFLFLGGGCKSRQQIQRDGEKNGILLHNMKPRKNQKEVKK